MASISPYPPRNCQRISYRLKLNGRFSQKSRYAKGNSQANRLKRQIEALEEATRTGVATSADIGDWIATGWIKQEEAEIAFPGYGETASRESQPELAKTDYERILEAYEDYVLENSKGGPERKSYKNHLNMASQVISWLRSEFPDLGDLEENDIIAKRRELKQRYSQWTIHHYLTKLRLLLDQAVSLGMISENPARSLKLKQPKKSTERRILTQEEIQLFLELSLNHRKKISGSLPTVVRLGLYAGLRDEEMCWLKWDAIDFEHGIVSIRETECEVTGRKWIPKNYEVRRLDVKDAFLRYLVEERKRQEGLGILGSFVMPAGHWKKTQYRGRPLTPEQPQKALLKMINDEGLASPITVYSFRHTYATMLLRKPPHGAGLDIRTVQKRLGHSDIKTTMEYLHYIEPEEHLTDGLPY